VFDTKHLWEPVTRLTQVNFFLIREAAQAYSLNCGAGSAPSLI